MRSLHSPFLGPSSIRTTFDLDPAKAKSHFSNTFRQASFSGKKLACTFEYLVSWLSRSSTAFTRNVPTPRFLADSATMNWISTVLPSRPSWPTVVASSSWYRDICGKGSKQAIHPRVLLSSGATAMSRCRLTMRVSNCFHAGTRIVEMAASPVLIPLL